MDLTGICVMWIVVQMWDMSYVNTVASGAGDVDLHIFQLFLLQQ